MCPTLQSMIVATLILADPLDPEGCLQVDIPMHGGYGATPELAHEILLLCLTATEWPIVVDADGAPWSVPVGSVLSVITQALPRTTDNT